MSLWIERATTFFRQLESRVGKDIWKASGTFEAPMDRELLDRYLDSTRIEIPRGLYVFSTHHAAQVDMWWEAAWSFNDCIECVGGIYFQNPIRPVEEGFNYCREWGVAEDFPGAVSCEQLLSSLVFSRLTNGDAIGLDCRNGIVDPPVVFSDHELEFPDQPFPQFADSFDEFLDLWERVCYLGPDLHVLSVRLDAKGRISPVCAIAEMLQSSLRVGP